MLRQDNLQQEISDKLKKEELKMNKFATKLFEDYNIPDIEWDNYYNII